MTKEPQRNGVATKIGAALAIIVLLVGAVTFTVRAEMRASAAHEAGKDQEKRLRDVEQAQTKTSTKLDAIHETVKDIKAKLDHMDRKEER